LMVVGLWLFWRKPTATEQIAGQADDVAFST
jgi:hypothetical protein